MKKEVFANDLPRQEQRVYNCLIMGKKLCVADISKITGACDPRRHIARLRARGVNVLDEWQKSGYGVRYKRYFIKPSDRLAYRRDSCILSAKMMQAISAVDEATKLTLNKAMINYGCSKIEPDTSKWTNEARKAWKTIKDELDKDWNENPQGWINNNN